MRARVLLVGTVVGMLVGASPAAAGDNPGPPSKASAFDQYVEQIPTASGSKPAGAGGRKRPLPPPVQARMRAEGGRDAAALEKIATSPGLGAPERALRPSGAKKSELLESLDDGSGMADTVTAALSAATNGSDGRLLGLGVVLAALTLAMAGAALAGLRSS